METEKYAEVYAERKEAILDGPKPKHLVMFSGGMDSFITACMRAEDDGPVALVSFNGGSMVAEENLLHGVTRLQNRYGKELVQYGGIYNTSAIIARLNKDWIYKPQKELAERWPSLINAQLNCLHCQASMWSAAIAYASTRGIPDIAA